MSLPTDYDARKRLQMFTYLMEYFPDSFLAELEVAIAGNEQHNPGEKLHWARGKSMDQMNTAMRHMFDYGSGVKKDTDGQYHLAKAIWRLKAQLQLDIEAERVAAKMTIAKDALGSVLCGNDRCFRISGHGGGCTDLDGAPV
jgi:hypothetical protein